jgi:hypothetical protein
VSALLGAAQVIMVNSALVWKFIASRTEVKKAAIQAKYGYLTAQLRTQESLRAPVYTQYTGVSN